VYIYIDYVDSSRIRICFVDIAELVRGGVCRIGIYEYLHILYISDMILYTYLFRF